MRSAIAVFHHTSNSENPKPVAAARTQTTTTGATAPNAISSTGQPASTTNAARIGCRGRQRRPASAPVSAPTPNSVVTTPNSAAEP